MTPVLPGSNGFKFSPLRFNTLTLGGDADPGAAFESPVLASDGGPKFIDIAEPCNDGVTESVVGSWYLR